VDIRQQVPPASSLFGWWRQLERLGSSRVGSIKHSALDLLGNDKNFRAQTGSSSSGYNVRSA